MRQGFGLGICVMECCAAQRVVFRSLPIHFARRISLGLCNDFVFSNEQGPRVSNEQPDERGMETHAKLGSKRDGLPLRRQLP